MLIATANLMEAEGRTLRRVVLLTGVQLLVLAGALTLALAGIGLLLWAAYQGLAVAIGPSAAAVFLGLLLFILAGVLTWLMLRLSR